MKGHFCPSFPFSFWRARNITRLCQGQIFESTEQDSDVRFRLKANIKPERDCCPLAAGRQPSPMKVDWTGPLREHHHPQKEETVWQLWGCIWVRWLCKDPQFKPLFPEHLLSIAGDSTLLWCSLAEFTSFSLILNQPPPFELPQEQVLQSCDHVRSETHLTVGRT